MENLAFIFVSVLASSAVACGVVLWTTSTTDTRMNRLVLQLSTVAKSLQVHGKRLDDAEMRLREHASTALKAAVDDLTAAVDADRARLRKELGRLWARQRAEPAASENGVDDDELAAMLALQNAGTPPS